MSRPPARSTPTRPAADLGADDTDVRRPEPGPREASSPDARTTSAASPGRVTALLSKGTVLACWRSVPDGAQTAIALSLVTTFGTAMAGTVLVLVWHGLRGTKTGPAGEQLLRLIQMLFTFLAALVWGPAPSSR